MKFNIDEIIKDMVNASFNVIKNEVPKKQKEVKKIFDEHKKSFEEILEKRITGQYTDSDVQYFLKQREKLLKIKLYGLNIESKINAEKAVNASIDVFNRAIKKVINKIL